MRKQGLNCHLFAAPKGIEAPGEDHLMLPSQKERQPALCWKNTPPMKDFCQEIVRAEPESAQTLIAGNIEKLREVLRNTPEYKCN